ncbi:uncharacterized protein LOC133897170 isoform X2 [Phragmites australis]|uniref:uncharacterized protein LOC133897170 isoform X2 n=1 Tax=Phragmites australis TaxID=29695 RepID=UPI002D773D79|nr:uncharacterized protein LOC133897170 isoform X2 [Phragmites australis]
MGTDEKRRGKEAAALSGGHLCHVCGYQYPNSHPSAKLRRSHRKHCGKVPAPAPAVVEEEAVVGLGVGGREERNASEGTLLGGGQGERRSASEANGGSALRGSVKEARDSVEDKEIAEHASPNSAGAEHVANEFSENGLINCINSEKVSLDDTGVQVITSEFSENGFVDCTSNSIEIVNEGNGTELLVACTNGSRNKVAKHCTGIAPVAVGHPAEHADGVDEYQDASPFLHQSDSEDVAAPNSEFSLEIKNLNTVSSGTSVAASEFSLEKYGSWKDQFSREPTMTDLENGTLRLAGPEVSLKLGGPYECSVNVDSNYTHKVDIKSDKTSGHSELIDDSNVLSLQETHPLILETESESTCSGKVEGFIEDSTHVLNTMSEASPKQVVGSDNVQLETITDPSTNTVPNGNELKVIYSDPRELPTQDWTVADTPDVQLPVESSCQEGSVCSTAGFQNDLPVTNVDDMLNSIAEDSCSELDFTFEDRAQPHIVEQIVNTAKENPLVQNTHGFTKVEVCNKQIDPELSTEDQFSTSQKQASLQMDQMSSDKNPYNLDDARNDDLFELPTGSCYLEVPSAVASRQQVDCRSLIVDQLTVSNQTRMAEAQHCRSSNECILSASSASENGHAVGPENIPVSSSAELMKNTCLTDAPLDHGLQEDEAHTSSIPFVPSQAAPMEFRTVSTQDISALGTDVEENMRTEDATAKVMTAVHNIDAIEMKQADNTTTKNTYAANVEEKKLAEDTAAEMNQVQHKDYVEQKKQDGGTKEVSAVQSMGNLEEHKQTEVTNANEMNAWFKADEVEEKRQADDTSAEKTNAIGRADGFEEKMLAQDTRAKEMVAAQGTGNVEEKQQENGTVGQEGNNQDKEIAVTGVRLNSGRVHAPLKVLLAEASVENKVKKPSAKEQVLSFRRRVLKDDNSWAKSGSPKSGSDDLYWNSPAMPRKDIVKRSKGRKQPWIPFMCCHSRH